MRTLEEHRAAVAQRLASLPVIDVALDDARGAMLAAPLFAAQDLPATAVSRCDGYVVAAADIAGASAGNPVVLPVTHDGGFDPRGKRRHVAGTASRVPSGAPIPEGADAVIAVAETDGGIAQVQVSASVSAGHNVRAAGSDVPDGVEALSPGQRIAPRHMALAAALGVGRLRVHPAPRVVVIAVGQELSEPGRSRGRAGVPETSGVLLTNLVRAAGAQAFRVVVPTDDRAALRRTIEDQIVRADVVITVGGLSGSRTDSVAPVLAQWEDFEVVEVGLTPGGFHGLGSVTASGRTVPVVALPGRPVAALVAFEAYVHDALRAMSGHYGERAEVTASVSQGWKKAVGVVQAVPLWLESGGSTGTRATPLGDPRDPSLVAVAQANGVVFVPAEASSVRTGALLRCQTWGV